MDSSDANDSSGNESSLVAMDSEDSSSNMIFGSGYALRLDNMGFEALYTINEDSYAGIGRDIDGIFEFNKDRVRELLRKEIEKLVSEGKVEKVGNRYKIPRHANATEDSTTPQESPNTSLVPTASEETPEIDTTEKVIDATVKIVAVAEDYQLQAKEAQELADRHVQLLELESYIILQLVVEIFDQCDVHLLTTS